MKKIQWLYLLAAILLVAGCGSTNSSADLNLIPVAEGNDFGYINKKGEFVINPQFSNATLFKDGMALVSAQGSKTPWGFIDEKGKYVIPPSFKYATIFSEGLAFVVNENEAPKAIDEKGETKFTLQNAEAVRPFHDGLAGFSVFADDGDRKWGFVDKNGTVKISPQFYRVGNFSEGKCAATIEINKYVYIDKDGKIIINNQFDGAGEFHNGKAIVVTGKKCGVINDKGSYIINPQFSGMYPDGDNYIITMGDKVGWADKEGKIIINPQYDDAKPFYGNDLAPVSVNKEWGYIDKEGKIKINPQFYYVLPFNGSMALVRSGNKFGFIDKGGKYTINPQFDEISPDLMVYLASNHTEHSAEYTYIETEFYDIGAITAKVKEDITPDGVRGVSLNTPMARVMAKFGKQQSDFNQYVARTILISNEKIGHLASVNIAVIGTPYTNQQSSYTDTTKVFNDQATPQEFLYTLTPFRKVFDKRIEIMDAIEKDVFSTYSKDISSTPSLRIYTNASEKIMMQDAGTVINIYVLRSTYVLQ